jgi:hypothetical protein
LVTAKRAVGEWLDVDNAKTVSNAAASAWYA